MLTALFHWIWANVPPPHCATEISPGSSYSQPNSHALHAYSRDWQPSSTLDLSQEAVKQWQPSSNLPASSFSQITSVPFLEVTGKFSCFCCRKGHPFQGPRVDSCLTFRNELSEEIRVLTKQETLLRRGTWVREPRGTALPRASQSQVLL